MATRPTWKTWKKGFLPMVPIILIGIGIYYWYSVYYCPSSGVEKIAGLVDELQQAYAVYSLTGDKATFAAKLKELIPALLFRQPHGCWSQYQARQQHETECPSWAQKRVMEIMQESQQYAIAFARSPNLDIGAVMRVSQQFDQELAQLPKACLGLVQPPQGGRPCPQEWSIYDQCLERNKRIIAKQAQQFGPFAPELVGACYRPVCPKY